MQAAQRSYEALGLRPAHRTPRRPKWGNEYPVSLSPCIGVFVIFRVEFYRALLHYLQTCTNPKPCLTQCRSREPEVLSHPEFHMAFMLMTVCSHQAVAQRLCGEWQGAGYLHEENWKSFRSCGKSGNDASTTILRIWENLGRSWLTLLTHLAQFLAAWWCSRCWRMVEAPVERKSQGVLSPLPPPRGLRLSKRGVCFVLERVLRHSDNTPTSSHCCRVSRYSLATEGWRTSRSGFLRRLIRGQFPKNQQQPLWTTLQYGQTYLATPSARYKPIMKLLEVEPVKSGQPHVKRSWKGFLDCLGSCSSVLSRTSQASDPETSLKAAPEVHRHRKL